MSPNQIRTLAQEIAKQSLIDFTKSEMLTPEAAETFKQSVIDSVEICLSGFVEQYDTIP
jgi:hypothetical protein